jgi:hypothetical protein
MRGENQVLKTKFFKQLINFKIIVIYNVFLLLMAALIPNFFIYLQTVDFLQPVLILKAVFSMNYR